MPILTVKNTSGYAYDGVELLHGPNEVAQETVDLFMANEQICREIEAGLLELSDDEPKGKPSGKGKKTETRQDVIGDIETPTEDA